VSRARRPAGFPARLLASTLPTAAAMAATVATIVTAGGLTACRQASGRPAEVLPNHGWRTVKAGGGPTYTFRPGQQVELGRGTTTMSGTYQFPTDSTVVLDVAGLLPGLGEGGPTHLTLRFDARVLPDAAGRQRIELRAGTGVDTLARVD